MGYNREHQEDIVTDLISLQILTERKLSNMKHLTNTVRQYAINCQDQIHGSVFQASLQFTFVGESPCRLKTTTTKYSSFVFLVIQLQLVTYSDP